MWRLCVLGAVCAMLAPVAAAQSGALRPDLQGAWHNRWVVPLERPASATGLIVSEAEAMAYAATNSARPGVGMEAPFFGPETVAPLKIGGQYRSSVIVDPPDGRIPYTDEGARQRAAYTGPSSEGPELRTTSERCLGGWSRAPVLTNAVGNLRQIFQTPDSVVIWSDYNTEVRIIPLDGRKPARGLFQGESSGRWEGDTLVVETTNFRADEPVRQMRWATMALRPQSRITERFTKVSRDEIRYSFTVEDDVLYRRPWTGESVFLRSSDHVLEFACHEGNYSLRNILSGARAVERRRGG
jgi:hypothetical protein